MTLEEQRRIARDMGRLAAWQGRIHRPSGLFNYPELQAAWESGVEDQCEVMSDAAAKIPLLFSDERVSKSPVR